MTTRQESLIRGCGQRVLFSGEVSGEFEGIRACITQGENGIVLRAYAPSGEEVVPSAETICCAGKYLWDQGIRECPVTVSSEAGEHLILCSTGENVVTAVTAGVGTACFVPKNIPLRFEKSLMNDVVSLPGVRPFRLTALHFRTPYAVVFLESAGDYALLERGQEISSMALFPRGAEVLFAYVQGERTIHLRAYHRDGSTSLRGNDVCAALAAAVAVGRCLPDTAVTVPLPDGEVRAVCTKGWDLFLTCPVRGEMT